MKQKKDYTLLALFIPFMFALVASGAFSGCGENKPVKEGCVNYYNCDNFKVGDTLYPDYPHEDTLIVSSIANADTLNIIFAELSPKVATDAEIDSVLHKYCRTYHHTCKWKLCPYKGITSDNFGKAVAAYVGNYESDAFSLDMLHLYSPAAEYEELETMLRED
jgi:hypothetical protein